MIYQIRIERDEVQFLVAGRVQHRWDDSSKVGNIAAARAYLRAIGAVGVQVEPDGVSGWWSIDTSDERQHLEDDIRSSNFTI